MWWNTKEPTVNTAASVKARDKYNQQNKMRLSTFRATKKHTVVLAVATLNAIEVVQVTILSLTSYETNVNNL